MSRVSIAPSESRRTLNCSPIIVIGVDRRAVSRDNGFSYIFSRGAERKREVLEASSAKL